VKRDGRITLRAKFVRLGLSWFVKRRTGHETLEQSRRRLLAMEAVIPRPPRDTETITISVGGVSADQVITPASRPNRHVLYLHGGGYRLGAPSTYRHFTWRIASAAQARALVVDYRLAPENPFPAALEDAVSYYCWLLAEGADARQIVVIGDSAGGGLALALLLKLRDSGLPRPAAAVVLSPWTDLALTGASFTLNAKLDAIVHAEDAPIFAADYLAGADPRHPYASPLYGDPTGLPPTLIQVSSEEVLRDDAVRMAEKMQRAHCQAELQIWPQMPHVWHVLAPIVPEAREAIAEISKFVRRTVTTA
jgi:monoterpene epsilon-lactone hydrolase